MFTFSFYSIPPRKEIHSLKRLFFFQVKKLNKSEIDHYESLSSKIFSLLHPSPTHLFNSKALQQSQKKKSILKHNLPKISLKR